MRYNHFRRECSRFLEDLAESLDIPMSLYEKAKDRYKAVGDWLDRENGPLALFEPDMYSQGSFRLGTVVKPTNDVDDYDIDLVCLLQRPKSGLTQKQLKKDVGDELFAYTRANSMKSMPENKRRCWTIEYADRASFHMDILPAIPDDEAFISSLIRAGVPRVLAVGALVITDDEHENYSRLSNEWPRSNPRGYAGWFMGRMKVCQEEVKRQLVAMEKYKKVEEVPDFEAKTPLQRSIQILKRHRDIMFQNDHEEKPISIIITTLAAHAYNNESDLLEAMIAITDGMESHIRIENGVPWVANPVNPTENFADKWPGSQKERRCRAWLARVRSDIAAAVGRGEINKFFDNVTPLFDEQITNIARARMQLKKRVVKSPIRRATTALSKFNVSWRGKPDWPMTSEKQEFPLIARLSKRHGFRPYTYVYANGGECLEKGLTICFQAQVECTPEDKVYWQVTNTGDEARWAGDLRGGFQVGEAIHEERTKYSGEHCIQCFVVHNGVCIARSDEFVVRIK